MLVDGDVQLHEPRDVPFLEPVLSTIFEFMMLRLWSSPFIQSQVLKRSQLNACSFFGARDAYCVRDRSGGLAELKSHTRYNVFP